MKKKLFITVAILTTLINVFSFLQINRNAIDKLLFDKTTISFNFHTKGSNESNLEFLKKLNKFSLEYDVEIAQYSFLSSNKIDIYSTIKDEYEEALIIPNFIFNRDIKVHGFEKILDVGFKNLLYINTKDEGIIKNLLNELKNECELYNLESIFKDDRFLLDRVISYLDVDYLSMFIFFIFVFILVIFFYYSSCRKEYLIHQLWGYTSIRTYLILNKPLYISLSITIILSNVVMIGFLFKFIISNLLLEVVFIIMTLNAAIILLIFLISIALYLTCFTKVNSNNRKKGLSKVIFISYISKFILVLLVIILFNNLTNQKLKLNKNLENLTQWNNTKNLFNVHQTYSPFYHDNLSNEVILNNKILKVYKDLSDLNKVFLINTINFERTDENYSNIQNNQNYDYNYILDLKNETDLYGPYGRNIVVDKNYLKKHTIRTSNGKSVIELIDDNKNILNILVPSKLKSYKNIIENSYKRWFYFQKVEVPNIYKEASNQNKIEKDIEDLKINIIYIENKQRHFTYNKYSGDSANTVEDPIITVFTENVDNSFLASFLGHYMIIESTDEYSALKEINSITQKYNAIELNSVSSVYDQKGQEIKNIEDSIKKLIINSATMCLLIIILMIIIMISYYNSYCTIIVVKSLHGHHFSYIYRNLLLANLFINLIILPFVFLIYKKISLSVIVVIILMSILDYLVAKIVNLYLLFNGEMQFMKGELK